MTNIQDEGGTGAAPPQEGGTALSTAERELKTYLTGIRVRIRKSREPSEYIHAGDLFWGMLYEAFNLWRRFWGLKYSGVSCGSTNQFLSRGVGESRFLTTGCLGVADNRHVHAVVRWGHDSETLYFEIKDVRFENTPL